MNFLNQLLRGISFIPALVNGIEGLLGGRSGAEKKDAAMSFLENALATVDAIAAREIVNPEQFRLGISKIVDGTVQCLNASTWAKGGSAAATLPPQSQFYHTESRSRNIRETWGTLRCFIRPFGAQSIA